MKPQTGAAASQVILVNPYELGRQPFALAEPTDQQLAVF